MPRLFAVLDEEHEKDQEVVFNHWGHGEHRVI